MLIRDPTPLFKFADDMKMCHIFDPSTASDNTHEPLQHCINRLYSWCIDNCLPLNESKCSVVHFGMSNPRQKYYIEQHELAKHSTERDLGVTFDESLTFQPHIDSIVNRARRLAGFIFRSFQSRSAEVILPIYRTIIRPILEYASVTWNPYLQKQVKQLEAVQRCVTKRINGYTTLSYEERLSALKLPRLSARREYFDLVEIFKVLRGLSYVKLRTQLSFLSRTTRGHAYRLRPGKFKRNVRKTALFVRASNKWNLLPASVAEVKKLSLFKSHLRTYMSM
jgi:hypothetical protein